MTIALPASTDIYLTGGKSHSSEIRLAKYMMKELTSKSVYLDIGAHYGYFSIIASQSIQKPNQLFSFEPSPQSFQILSANQKRYPLLQIFNLGIGESPTQLTFYQFPNLYSEYNSFDIEQYKTSSWFINNPPKEIIIESTTIDKFVEEKQIQPTFIKIDVEGFEDKVMNGAIQTIERFAPTIVMEFVSENRHNENHKTAQKFLQDRGYQAFVIDECTELIPIEQISDYLNEKNVESDNIVFIKAIN